MEKKGKNKKNKVGNNTGHMIIYHNTSDKMFYSVYILFMLKLVQDVSYYLFENKKKCQIGQ